VTAEIKTLWRTATLRCELVSSLKKSTRVLLWIGAQLAFEQAVSSYAEALTLADQLKTLYGM